MTAAPPRAPVVPLPRRPADASAPADAAAQQRRRLTWTATPAGLRVRASPVAGASIRRRQTVQLCGAARLLTAVGIRVAVVQPEIPWPRNRAHRLRVTNDAGLLGDLALLTGVPRTASGWAAVADRVLPVGTTLGTVEPAAHGEVVCPVTVRYRTETGPLAQPPRTLAEVVAIDGLVLEVRLHPAIGSGRAA